MEKDNLGMPIIKMKKEFVEQHVEKMDNALEGFKEGVKKLKEHRQEKEFNLSEKTCLVEFHHPYKKELVYPEEYIKEFIKETEKDMRNHRLSRIGMVERFNKRAGDKLTK